MTFWSSRDTDLTFPEKTKRLGSVCGDGDVCRDENAVCQDQHCRCRGEFYEDDTGLCSK